MSILFSVAHYIYTACATGTSTASMSLSIHSKSLFKSQDMNWIQKTALQRDMLCLRCTNNNIPNPMHAVPQAILPILSCIYVSVQENV